MYLKELQTPIQDDMRSVIDDLSAASMNDQPAAAPAATTTEQTPPFVNPVTPSKSIRAPLPAPIPVPTNQFDPRRPRPTSAGLGSAPQATSTPAPIVAVQEPISATNIPVFIPIAPDHDVTD